MERPLILASASPRRRDLLGQIAVPHVVHPADIDESRIPGESPEFYVRRLALEKARAVGARHPGCTILAADTTVVLEGCVLNKPADRADAARMLRSLAGCTHHVHTGIAVLSPGEGKQPRESPRAQTGAQSVAQTHVETTAVTFTAIASAELEAYLATGDSLDKAGAYGIQGYAARWIARIDGDFFNVVGLPLVAVLRLLREAEGRTQSGRTPQLPLSS